MKKLLLFPILFLMIFSFSLNQAEAQNRPGFGIRGGLNFANLNDIDADVDSRTGIMLGVYTNFLIPNSPVYIQPEVLYTQKGYEVGDGTVKLDYIEIPVLARFDFITDGNITPNVYFGPYIGFNVNAEAEGDGGELDIDEAVEGTDFGVVVGGGLDFGRIDLGVRYGAGLSEIFEDGPFGDGSEAKNGVISITAGLDI